MRNYAFSPEYAQQYREQSEALFRPENRRTKEEGCFANGYFLLCETYEGELDGVPRTAARYSLFTPNHDLVLSYDCLDNEHALSEMIKHNNGVVYYLFRRDRFGFSVFNLVTLTEHRYYSEEAFKTGSDFIWCGAEYYPDRNTIFVVGHVPGAPFEVYEFDFTDPMTCVAFVPEDALILTLPSTEFADEMEDFRDEYLNWGEEEIIGSALLASYDDIAEWFAFVDTLGSRKTAPSYYMPSTPFVAFRMSDGLPIGMIEIKHELNDYMSKHGGHISYSVRPSERRRGYGKRILAMVLPYAKLLGHSKVLVVCHTDNEPSRRTILADGGVYEQTYFSELDNIYNENYWIRTTPALVAEQSQANIVS
ncbi:MAG: GNAT family N-acetyltransferase [Clostridiales bacterium]|nr:GNAT family N-acetyltransferase [Clostridiales bacterium]